MELPLHDLKMVVQQLKKANVYERIPGRHHSAYKNFDSFLFPNVKKNIIGFYKWLAQKKRELGKIQNFH